MSNIGKTDLYTVSVQEWLGSFRTANTRKTYLMVLRTFLKGVGIEGYEDTVAAAQRYADEVKEGKRQWLEDLAKFLMGSGLSPKSKSLVVDAVEGMLVYCVGIDITPREKRFLRRAMPPVIRPITIDEPLNKEKIKKILDVCPKDKKIFFLTMESSGARISEVLGLKKDDIRWDGEDDIPTLVIRNQKSGGWRYTFADPIVGTYLKSSIAITEDETRLFNYVDSDMHHIWRRCLKKAGLYKRDPNTGRVTISPHSLRKFFISRMKLAVPDEIVESLVGHQGYLSGAYRRYTLQELKEWYIKGLPEIQIYA